MNLCRLRIFGLILTIFFGCHPSASKVSDSHEQPSEISKPIETQQIENKRCTSRRHCTGKEVCVEGQCVLCDQDSDCKFCEKCVNQECKNTAKCCVTKGDCLYGLEVCLNHLCVDVCTDIRCPENHECYEGECLKVNSIKIP